MRSLILVLTLFSSLTLHAADFSGIELFIPVISRTPGAGGTQWRTDLIIANRNESEDTDVKLVYRPSVGPATQSTFEVPATGSVTIPDVLLTTFGQTQSYGTLWLGSLNEEANIVAHVRIYNVGNSAGEFGQLIQALPIDTLSKRVWMNGINGINGNRTNVGIANPSSVAAKYSLNWYDRSGNLQGTLLNLTVQPWEVVLFNEIFSTLHSAPDNSVSILLNSDRPLYAYASVVRNDTGDAYTITGDGTDN
ncbi:MAG TPA: hypothetical protein VGQ76_12265 [Thermoanaerobaculia bacterium]|jgi:hypothetical protein|nr:hypothetical protein [Thermoanaerobaculia bacterium]